MYIRKNFSGLHEAELAEQLRMTGECGHSNYLVVERTLPGQEAELFEYYIS